jgi:hypothetical protein
MITITITILALQDINIQKQKPLTLTILLQFKQTKRKQEQKMPIENTDYIIQIANKVLPQILVEGISLAQLNAIMNETLDNVIGKINEDVDLSTASVSDLRYLGFIGIDTSDWYDKLYPKYQKLMPKTNRMYAPPYFLRNLIACQSENNNNNLEFFQLGSLELTKLKADSLADNIFPFGAGAYSFALQCDDSEYDYEVGYLNECYNIIEKISELLSWIYQYSNPQTTNVTIEIIRGTVDTFFRDIKNTKMDELTPYQAQWFGMQMIRYGEQNARYYTIPLYLLHYIPEKTELIDIRNGNKTVPRSKDVVMVDCMGDSVYGIEVSNQITLPYLELFGYSEQALTKGDLRILDILARCVYYDTIQNGSDLKNIPYDLSDINTRNIINIISEIALRIVKGVDDECVKALVKCPELSELEHKINAYEKQNQENYSINGCNSEKQLDMADWESSAETPYNEAFLVNSLCEQIQTTVKHNFVANGFKSSDENVNITYGRDFEIYNKFKVNPALVITIVSSGYNILEPNVIIVE